MAGYGYYGNTKGRQLLYKIMYIIIGGVIITVMVLLFNLVASMQADIANSDERVIASVGGSGSALPLITVGYFLLSAMIFIFSLTEENLNKERKRNQMKVQRKRKKKNNYYNSPNIRVNRKLLFGIWLGVLIILMLCSAFFGFNGRKSLHDDGSIHIYNSVGRETAVYNTDDIEKIELNARWLRVGKHGRRWTFGINFYTEDENFWYECRDFSYDGLGSVNSALRGMSEMKEIYSGTPIEIIGVENLETVTDELGLYEPQRLLLYELFEAA